MALFQASSRIFGHKHFAQTLTEKIVIAAVILLTVFSTVVPNQVLAFETKLDISPAGALEASVQLLRNEDFLDDAELVYEINYTDRLSSSVRVSPGILTETGAWPVTKIASHSYRSYSLPDNGNPLILQGEASYYSWDGCLGCNPRRIMANGQPLNDNALTMAIGAHLSHLVGRQAKVTNLHTGESVNVVITDTGGFYQSKYGSRVADLTIATKNAIGISGGLGQVKVEVY